MTTRAILGGLMIAALVLIADAAANAAIIALYDFEAAGGGNTGGNTFDDGDTALFSVDTDPDTVATRLASTEADGGGANNIFNGTHDGGASGAPATNWAQQAVVNEANAVTISFTTAPTIGTSLVTYESIQAYHASFDGNGSFKITYAIGAGADVDALPATGLMKT